MASLLEAAAARRLGAWQADAAVVFGSGLAALPPGAETDEELPYGDLGWPRTVVPGHRNALQLVRVTAAGGRELKLALACGRPHRYEGWSDGELEQPVRALAAAGVRRLLLTNSCGGLRPGAAPGAAVVCERVIDLQRPPRGAAPPVLPVCTAAAGERLVAALLASPVASAGLPPAAPAGAPPAASPGPVRALRGAYVAVAGPHFESPAEARWLARYGDVVGMSAAPELRAARAAGASCALVALVVNRAAEVGSHDDVLAASGRLAGALADRLVAALTARWPELAS
ncbi:MAG: hypothetical protein WC709_05135 [Thermoleophilia bacterium]